MKKFTGSFLFIVSVSIRLTAQQADYNAIVNRYVQQYKDIAVEEMKIYHVPASITLAQGVVESAAGRSDLAVKANNHFGIKCHKEWTGMTFYKDDETKNECFRKYDDPVESFRDHTRFLTQRERYKSLFRLDVTDYKGWANGLKSAGYATNPAYAQLLINTIETYALYRFDHITFSDATAIGYQDDPFKAEWLNRFVFVSRGAGNRNIYENNRLRMIIAADDDNIYVIARDFNISVDNLLKYNELSKPTSLKPRQIVYLQKKRRKCPEKHHTVGNRESLYTISQLYGIRLKLLCKRNKLDVGSQPPVGAVLRLR